MSTFTILIILNSATIVCSIFLFYKNRLNIKENQIIKKQFENLENTQQEYKLKELKNQEKIEKFIEELSSTKSEVSFITNENDELKNKSREKDIEIQNITSENSKLSKDLACQIQENSHLKQEHEKMQKFTENSIKKANESAKSAIFEVGSKLSDQLINQHRRETEENKLTNQHFIEKTTSSLNSQFEKIVKSVSTLDEQVKNSSETVDIIKRTMLSPNSIGGMAEITLENILKSSGLISGKDFFMQFSINSGLRPDALILLPSNNLIVIDSKASKFFFEMNYDEKNPEIEQKLKNTMKTHLKSLSSKEYALSVKDEFENHHKKQNGHITTIMFLQSDLALEKIIKIDPEFIYRAWEKNIFPTGPTGLISILSHAKFQISENNQIANYQQIILEIKKMVKSLSTLHDHAKKIGTSLHSAAQNYDRFAASFNGNFSKKINNLQKMGLDLDQQNSKSNNLDRYQIITSKDLMIEHESVKEE